jgi:Asp/Glu/hydantoin racemase
MMRKSGTVTYGEAIGIVMVDTEFPRIPGDVGNATTYRFPVKYKVAKGLHMEDIVRREPHPSVGRRVVDVAKELEEEGVRAVTTSCGYFIYFQDELAEALDIPVFSSSLIQVPMVAKMLGHGKKVGIICAYSEALTEKHLEKAGIDDSIQVAIAGIDEHWEGINREEEPRARLKALEKTLTTVSRQLVSKDPEVGAIVLECTNLPPGASAVQEATGLPVFDIITLINMIYDVVVRKRYRGHM